MADIFFSYAAEDRDRIEPLVKALQGEGWSVWWDRELVAGPSFDEKIEEELDAARCVVVAWSKNSIKSRWCRTEANEGLERQVLVPMTIDEVRPPLAFRSSQTASLNGWPQEPGELDALLSGIRQCLGVSSRVSTKPDSEMKSIAVLPFVNMSSDPEQEYFVDGLTEDLIDRLAKHASLRVIARTSSFYFKNRADDVRAIGARLGVTHLVEGSVRRVGTKIRITAQLVRTDDGSHEWSEHYDRELEDVFTLQDEITKEVTHQLTNLLIQPATTYQPKPEAYDEYLKGQTWLRKYSYSGSKRARSFFDRAIDADPCYAEAYAAAAGASLMEGLYSVEDEPEPLERAEDYVAKALSLDRHLATALLGKAKILRQRHFDHQGALNLLREVFSRDPNLWEAHLCATHLYEIAGRCDLAEDSARKIIQMDPMNITGYVNLSFLCLVLGRLDEAENAMDTVLAMEPDHTLTKSNMLILKARQGRIDEGLAFIEKHGLQNYATACFVYAAAGRRDEIERVIAVMEARSGFKTGIAQCYALLGDLKSVLRCLKQAIDNHDELIFHLTGPYHECIDIEGIKLGTMYDSEEVQELLTQANLDKESIRRLEI